MILILTYVFVVFFDTYMVTKSLLRIPLDIFIHWLYLHQDAGKTYSEISKMISYWKYSKAIICRQMKKNIGDLVVRLRKNNQERLQKLSFNKKRNILWQTKTFQKEVGNFCGKGLIKKQEFHQKTACRVLRKTALKWTRVQR